MRKRNKAVAILMSAAMMVSLGACGSSGGGVKDSNEGKKTAKSESDSELEPVTLRIYFCGDEKADAQKVWDAISEKYKDQLNCTFDVNWIGMGDYRDKLISMASSGDDWDLNYDGLWQAYAQMVAKDAYLDVSEMLPEYAPDLYKNYQDKGLIDAVKVKDQVFAIPWSQTSNFRPWVMWRADAAEKAGIDVENGSIQTMEQLDDLLHKFKEAYPDNTILALGTAEINQAMRAVVLRDGLMWADFHTMYYDINDPEQKLIPMEQTDTFRDVCKMVRGWVEDGIVSEDDMVDKTTDSARFGNGQALVRIRNHEESFGATNFADPTWTKGYSEMYPENKFYNRIPLGNAMCVNKNAKNPERALMFLNLLQTDRELYDMVMYGIEGETYNLNGDMVEYPEGMDGSNSNYLDWGGQWALYNPDYIRPTELNGPGFWQEEAAYAAEEKNIDNPVAALTITIDEIKNEIARRDQLYEEYGKPLIFGLVPMDEIDEKVDEYIQLQKDAGLDKILEVSQGQVDEFLAQ